MCGIAGIFDYRGPGEVDRRLLRRMTDILDHRGPDGDGFYHGAGIGLGHRRLAIVDLAGGDQPLFNEDRTVCVVYNGEIYNFQPLIAELTALGHVFRRAAIPRSSSMLGRSGASGASTGSTGNSLLRSGTSLAKRCFWRATASAKSRSITALSTAAGCFSHPS